MSTPLLRLPWVEWSGRYSLVVAMPGEPGHFVIVSKHTVWDRHYFAITETDPKSIRVRDLSFSVHQNGIDSVLGKITEFLNAGPYRAHTTAICDLAVVWYHP